MKEDFVEGEQRDMSAYQNKMNPRARHVMHLFYYYWLRIFQYLYLIFSMIMHLEKDMLSKFEHAYISYIYVILLHVDGGQEL